MTALQRENTAVCLAFWAVMLTCIALLVDQLTAFGKVSQLGVYGDCGWASWQESDPDVSGKYSSACNVGLDAACKTQTAGQLWLSLEIISVAFAIGACVLIAAKKNLAVLVFFVCSLLCIAGVICWIADNPLCYNEHLDDRSLGSSLILAIVCGCLYFIATVCLISVDKKGGAYTAMN
mmetsp:Transcript_61581/g.98096  ORF Transcript_61581/g.98096 Transcript_61581/m.98096 type:complete len:178 (+) Transcript_61581:71-604(+)